MELELPKAEPWMADEKGGFKPPAAGFSRDRRGALPFDPALSGRGNRQEIDLRQDKPGEGGWMT